MALKEFKGRMLPSAPSSTLTVTSSVPLRCGSFSCNTVRILVLPSGSVLLLMLATDFNLEIVENDCLRNSVLFEAPWRSPVWPLCYPWRSALSLWRLPEWSWKGGWLNAMCTFGHLVASRPGLLMFAFALTSSGCAAGSSIPSSWLLGPALSTKMVLISTFVTLFAPCWAFSRWMRCSTLTTYLTLTSGPGSSPRSLAFSCEGSDLIDCGRHCNSSIGLVSVKVLDGCFVLLCML